jgi:superfamily I DNA and RNA helicase
MGKIESQFIATELPGNGGESAEQRVWDAVRRSFRHRTCLAYWRYPIFSQTGKTRKEPDILIADRQWGLFILEVKAIAIEQILRIHGHQWQLQNFYTAQIDPYQQAENQLNAILQYCDAEPLLQGNITARSGVALPQIAQEQWQQCGFDRLPSAPPILFPDQLTRTETFLDAIAAIPPLRHGNPLSDEQWHLLLCVLAGTSIDRPSRPRILPQGKSRSRILTQARDRLYASDIQHERIGKTIPPGPQRIRGSAGSGKTVLLCQKAAHMHLKHPDWDIALVFFTRTLYAPILEQLDRWLQRFSLGQVQYSLSESSQSKLRVLHAWGSSDRPGLYSTVCEAAGIQRLKVNDLDRLPPHVSLATACHRLLQHAEMPQIFDAILIDEGQDFLVDETQAFGGKQPFYAMAYQALRDPKRLIWASDEAQCLESRKSATAGELLGSESAHLVTGQYPGGLKKTEVLSRCYRTPAPILAAAQAIGTGIFSANVPQAIQALEQMGYQLQGQRRSGERITLHRPPEQTPNFIPELWQAPVLELTAYRSRQEEFAALADRIWYNLKYDGLRPSREILVVVLGTGYEVGKLERAAARFLRDRGLDVFLPTTAGCNILDPTPQQFDRDRFWCVGGVTISRIHRAKGQEADMVYVVGLDRVAADDRNWQLRTQLAIAMTRSRGWLQLSGVGSYPLYDELWRAIESGDTFALMYPNLAYPHSGDRVVLHESPIGVTDVGELIQRYAPEKGTLAGANLAGVTLIGVDLQDADLIGTQLVEADLSGAILTGAKLAIANLTRANLRGANLRQAKLVGADLSGANLSGADLSGANLSGADLSGANLSGAIWVQTELADAILPEGMESA